MKSFASVPSDRRALSYCVLPCHCVCGFDLQGEKLNTKGGNGLVSSSGLEVGKILSALLVSFQLKLLDNGSSDFVLCSEI